MWLESVLAFFLRAGERSLRGSAVFAQEPSEQQLQPSDARPLKFLHKSGATES